MRNAAFILGMIGGLIGILVSLFGWGYTSFAEAQPDIARTLGLFENPGIVKAASFFAPLLAIGGAAMSRDRALWGGIAMIIGAGAFYVGFGFNVATLFPIGFVGLAGVLAIAARKPDAPVAH